MKHIQEQRKKFARVASQSFIPENRGSINVKFKIFGSDTGSSRKKPE
jgi:hypothetical protein